jgi:hypothetical protein
MAVTAHPYGPFVFGQFSGDPDRRIDWINDTIMVALLSAAYTPDQDAHGFFSDVNAAEITTPNYVAGGKELSEKTEQYDAASNTTRLKAKTVVWKEVSLEAHYAVVYKLGEEASSSPLIGFVDFGEVVKAASGQFKIEWDPTDGVLRGIAE